jgi:hypothetical protein
VNPLPSVHVPQPPGLKKSGVEDGHPPALLGGREVTGRLMLLHSRLGGFPDPQGFVFVPGGHALAILKDDHRAGTEGALGTNAATPFVF